MLNEEFIQLHLKDNVRALALKNAPEGVDIRWCLQQIEGRQLAEKKLPLWAKTEGLWFPPRLSMEQCSSEQTALYKQQLVKRLLPHDCDRQLLMDLTGGYGVDFSFLAPLFQEAVYMEKLPHLCNIVSHNLQHLGIHNGRIENREISSSVDLPPASLLYLDPARRDDAGRKTVAIEDCTPDVKTLMPALLENTGFIVLKLSPMLDIKQALRALDCVTEVHVLSVRNECKELLLVCSKPESKTEPTYYCVNLDADEETITLDATAAQAGVEINVGQDLIGKYLYEPNTSVLKAGVQDALCRLYGLKKLHPMSHLFVGAELIDHFPGRRFRVVDQSDFSKQKLKALLKDIKQANLTVRNFPSSVQELRKRLKLKEGGTDYLFATTLYDATHTLLRCVKP